MSNIYLNIYVYILIHFIHHCPLIRALTDFNGSPLKFHKKESIPGRWFKSPLGLGGRAFDGSCCRIGGGFGEDLWRSTAGVGFFFWEGGMGTVEKKKYWKMTLPETNSQSP